MLNKPITQTKLILFISIFLLLFDNYSFFHNVINVYNFSGMNILYVISLAILVIALTNLLLTLVSSKYTTKPIVILVIVVSAFTNYFMNSYNIVIDTSMIRNALQTDMKESLDLLSIQLVLYVTFLAIIPSFLVYKANIQYDTFWIESKRKIISIVLSLVAIAIVALSFSKFYTSFFREHKPLRYYTNPTYWIYSSVNYINLTLNSGPIIVEKIGLDAKIVRPDKMKHKLVVMVVGEAARADHFSLNGYSKDTNPLLEKRDDIIDFSSFYSCGTSTAYSVPCMFSPLTRDQYSHKKFIRKQNVMDVIAHTKDIAILWIDNNSDPKGVMDRLHYIDFKGSKCDGECRDENMLKLIPSFIKKHQNQDILVVLHQMGNHGPEYYKRYPKEFEKFKPVCKTNQLEKCTKEEINNAYDNAILYTDYFLNKTIDFTKQYQKDYQTALLYMSDHGESLGENGVYLHGMPYFMAPIAQKHIGAIAYFSKDFSGVEIEKLKQNKDKEYSQDYLFSTLLGLFDVQTKVYDKKLDINKIEY